MKNNKPKLITIVLILMIFFLLGSIFYITKIITNEGEDETTSNLVPKKTKASSLTYNKLIALNTISVMPTIGLITPTTEPSPTINQISPTNIASLSPTEIILALDNSKRTASQAAQISTSVSPTKITSLPETGFINNSLILFAAASVLILFAFIF